MDGLGHTRLLLDSSGNITDRYSYDAWGNPIEQAGTAFNPFRWNGAAGYEYVLFTGLYHVGAREYDPRTARWLQRDPIDAASGDPNLYRYAGNDPVNGVDQNGLIAFVPVIVGGAAIGALSGALISGLYELHGYLQGQSWDWRHIGHGAVLGAIGGAVAAPVISLLAPVLPVGLSGGIIGGAVGAVPANLVQQGFSCVVGWQQGFDPYQLGCASVFGALGGSVALRPGLFARGTITVTHWSPGGRLAPGPGKWVMIGGRTWRNYLFSGCDLRSVLVVSLLVSRSAMVSVLAVLARLSAPLLPRADASGNDVLRTSSIPLHSLGALE
ncbi:MAG: hypothetical protein KatS3mg022_0436 [Armatimonadota bacterium]|nr:MAG: hypothetical protein KatS3mg022_0436 [Armatimonadota bacterium]